MVRLKFLLLTLFVIIGPASTGHCARVALVIGNAAYESVATLPNPTSDADAIAEALKRLGFEVSLGHDTNKSELEGLLADFSEKAIQAEMAVVFYAGHGIEVAGENYLIPVDATLKSDARIKFETVSLSDILSAIDGGNGIKLVLLDACRDNPFVATMRGTRTRSIGRGLAKVEAADGIYISYAAAAGTTASDGEDKHSPYTEALLSTIEEPGLELNFLFRKVARYVKQKTKGAQTPFEYGRLPDVSVYLKPPVEEAAQPAKDVCSDAAAHWAAVENKASQPLFQAHLNHFGQCAFAELAKDALNKLESGENEQAVETFSDSSKPDPETAKDAGESETTSVYPNVSNNKPIETALALPEDNAPEVDLLALTRGVQDGLIRLGCEPGKADGRWGRQSQKAMERFNKFAGLSLDIGPPSEEVLSAIKLRTGRICPLECAPTEVVVGDRCERKACGASLTLNKAGKCVAATTGSTKAVNRKEARPQKQDPSGQATGAGDCFVLDGKKFCM